MYELENMYTSYFKIKRCNTNFILIQHKKEKKAKGTAFSL